MTKWFGMDEVRSSIISKHPIIKSIAIAQKGNNILYVDIVFHEPSFVFWTPLRRFALYQGQFFDVTSGNTLGSQSLKVDLPAYTADYDNLNGLLYQIDEYSLLTDITLIQETL
ncbi:MAG: hypothetical protein H6765_06805 [Candidatus Peribacteria bacterium]|nr:MAG: hypothetical protein H6765_06805 [Candidatus Peribacteria bacterium]